MHSHICGARLMDCRGRCSHKGRLGLKWMIHTLGVTRIVSSCLIGMIWKVNLFQLLHVTWVLQFKWRCLIWLNRGRFNHQEINTCGWQRRDIWIRTGNGPGCMSEVITLLKISGLLVSFERSTLSRWCQGICQSTPHLPQVHPQRRRDWPLGFQVSWPPGSSPSVIPLCRWWCGQRSFPSRNMRRVGIEKCVPCHTSNHNSSGFIPTSEIISVGRPWDMLSKLKTLIREATLL